MGGRTVTASSLAEQPSSGCDAARASAGAGQDECQGLRWKSLAKGYRWLDLPRSRGTRSGSLHWQRNRRWRAQEDEDEPAACHARRGATDVPPSDGRSDGRALGLAAVEIGGREQQAPHDELQERPEPVEDARASVDRHADHPAAEESQPEEGDEDELATVGAGRGREPEREGPEHHEGASVDRSRLDGALRGGGGVVREAHPLQEGQRHGEPGHAEDQGEQSDGGDDDPRIHATSRAAALPLSVWDVAASPRTVPSPPGTAGPGNTT